MANVRLEVNESIQVGFNGTVFGSTGTETVKIISDTAALKFDASVERVELGHASTDYTYRATPTGIQVLYKGAAIADLQAGEKLAFTDGSAVIAGVFDATTATATYTLGGKTVSTAGGSLTPNLNTSAGEISTVGSVATPTYSLTSAATSANEGASAIFNVVTTNVAPDTALAYSLTGPGITSTDVTGGLLSGTAKVGADGKATITVPLAADLTTEGPETLIVYLADKGAVAYTTINDTSLTSSGPAVVSVAAANTTAYDASAGAVKFTVASGTYTYNIAGFGSGDVLQFPSGNVASIENIDYTDGVVDVQWSAAGQTVIVHLTGINSANDIKLNSVADFNSLFGTGTII